MQPTILSEEQTLADALGGRSIARFGDGEIRLAYGNDTVSQKADPLLAQELLQQLRGHTESLTCLPNMYRASPKAAHWGKFKSHPFMKELADKEYGSSFITRPDSAPWIDNDDYWRTFSGLWRNKSVVLVCGTRRSLTPELMLAAQSVRVVEGPPLNAYAAIDEIEEKIGNTNDTVLICLGPAATVLVERLAKKGIHAVDVGHAGLFMSRRQVMKTDLVISDRVYKYLVAQVGDLSDLRAHRDAWLPAYKARMHNTLTDINHAMAGFASVLDIGSGVGAIDVLLHKQFGSHIILVDGEDDPPVVEQQYETFCSREVVDEFMNDNGVDPERYEYYSPAQVHDKFMPVDLIVSFHSWCFHYPPAIYMDFVKACCKPGTRLILDVRKDRSTWGAELRARFKQIKVIRSEKKYERIAFEVAK